MALPCGTAILRVACKTVKRSSFYSDGAYQREAEALVAARNCPHIVHLYGHDQGGRDQHVFRFFMELAPGGRTLDALLSSAVKDAQRWGVEEDELLLPEASARYYAACLLVALRHMHRSGIAHRDVKGANVLVGADGRLMLADFGTATQAVCNLSSTKHHRLAGTSWFMAPEVAVLSKDGEAVGAGYNSAAADVWSWGVVLLQMTKCSCASSVLSAASYARKVAAGRATWPAHVPPALADLLQHHVLVPEARRATFRQLMAHPWFEGVEWDRLLEQEPPAALAHLVGA